MDTPGGSSGRSAAAVENLSAVAARPDTSSASSGTIAGSTTQSDHAFGAPVALSCPQSNVVSETNDGSIYPETARLAALSIAALARQIHDSNPVFRRECIRELAHRKELSVEEDLIRALEDPDSTVKCAAVQALGEIGDGAAVKPILDTMDACRKLPDGYGPVVIRECVRTLGRIGDQSAVHALLAELNRPNNLSLYNDVCLSLAEIGDSAALKPIEDHIVRLMEHEPAESIAYVPWQEAVNAAKVAMETIRLFGGRT